MSEVGHLVYAIRKEIIHPILRKDRGINHGEYLSLPIDYINTTCLDLTTNQDVYSSGVKAT